MRFVAAAVLIAFLVPSSAASQSFKIDRLTAQEWDNLRSSLAQAIFDDAVIQRMIAVCPADAGKRLLSYYDRRNGDAAFKYYSDLFDGQLARPDFDALWNRGNSAKFDCAPETIARALESFQPGKLETNPAYQVGVYRTEAKERPATFLPATEAEALTRLRSVIARYTFEARGPNNSWALSRRFTTVTHANCKTTFSGGETLASTSSTPPDSFTIDWTRESGVAAFRQGTMSGVRIDGSWTRVGDVRGFIDATDHSFARGITGPLERLRRSCVKP